VSTSRPAVSLADALRAVDALAADVATAARIRALLGLDDSAEAGPAQLQRGPDRPPITPDRLGAPAVTPPSPRPVLARDGRPPESDLPPQGPGRPEISVTSSASGAPPRPLARVSALLDEPDPHLRLAPAALLQPGRHRALLGALCSSPADTGDLDVDRAVHRLARGEPLGSLPAEVRPTTRRGLEVLVDRGPAMVPFLHDQDDVLRSVDRLAGPDGVRIVRFARCPLDPPGAGTGPLWTWKEYRPPPAAVPVLALSDIGVLAAPEERAHVRALWVRFALRLRKAGCPLVALVPAPVARIPPELLAVVTVVTWDRSTGVRDATAAARRAGRRVATRRPS
jgi:hypothetical protein